MKWRLKKPERAEKIPAQPYGDPGQKSSDVNTHMSNHQNFPSLNCPAPLHNNGIRSKEEARGMWWEWISWYIQPYGLYIMGYLSSEA